MKPVTLMSVMAFALLGSVTLTAQAATNWNLATDCTTGCNTDSVLAGNAATFSNGLTASAWSSGKTDTSSATTFATAQLKNYGSTWGWGVIADPAGLDSESNNTGPHAMDNKYGTDMILLSFDEMVALNSVQVGWNGTDDPTSITVGTTTYRYIDSDISVLRYTGTVTPVIAGKSVGTLLSDGWSWVGDYGNVGALTNNTVSFNTTSPVYSSWWLVSAYNKNFDGDTNDTSGLNSANDAVKILQVAGNVRTPDNQTPEPGSLALLGAGLFGIMALRRRRENEA